MQSYYFFFNDTATTEIYTLSLHDALPISAPHRGAGARHRAHDRGGPLLHRRADAGRGGADGARERRLPGPRRDRKSTRLNSSHANISYAVFCLKNKNRSSSYTSASAVDAH